MKTQHLVLATLLTAMVWLLAAGMIGLYGGWMEPLAQPDDEAGFVLAAQQMVAKEEAANVALVLISQGEVVTTTYSGPSPINGDTLFATASFSKWVAALGVLALVEAGDIDLDQPVSRYLRSWQLPPSEFDDDEVTVRRLLSHTAGLHDGLGFGDYTASETLPTVTAELANPRSSDGYPRPIRVMEAPGSGFAYSGGGYLILEQLVEDVTGDPFHEVIQRLVFAPADMQRSTYGYLGDFQNTAGSLDSDGNAAAVYQYASSAATGLSSTANDLVRLVRAVEQGNIIAKPLLQQMRQPAARLFGLDIWGLGTILYAPTDGDDFVYGHDGANDPAINAAVRINPDNGDAIVALVTGHPSLGTKLGFEWVLWQTGIPDPLHLTRALKSAMWPSLVGLAIIVVLGFAASRFCTKQST